MRLGLFGLSDFPTLPNLPDLLNTGMILSNPRKALNYGSSQFFCMQAVLNFGRHEKEKVKGFLSGFPEQKTKNAFEEKRAEIGNYVVTLYSSGKVVVQGKEIEKTKELLLKTLSFQGKTVLGIDESGRGELHGCLVVAGVLGEESRLRELRDSKKTRDIAGKQETIDNNAKAVASFVFSPELIDETRKKGITVNELEAIAIDAIAVAFKKIEKNLEVIVDGKPLKEVKENVNFVVKADDSNAVVGAASVKAKFLRETSKNREKRKSWKNA